MINGPKKSILCLKNAGKEATVELKVKGGNYTLQEVVEKIWPPYIDLYRTKKTRALPPLTEKGFVLSCARTATREKDRLLLKWWYDAAYPKAGAYHAVHTALKKQDCIVLMATKGAGGSGLLNHVWVGIGCDDETGGIFVYDCYPSCYTRGLNKWGDVEGRRLITKYIIIK